MTTTTTSSGGVLSFGRGFTFFFEDEEWIKKALIGGLFTLLASLIVGIFFVAGYWTRLIRRVAAGEARPLPEWDDLGGIFHDGLKIVGVYLVLAVAMVVAFGVVFGCFALLGIATGALSHSSEAAGGLLGLFVGLGMIGVYGVCMLLALALGVYLPAALLRVVLYDRFGEAFAFGATIDFIHTNLPNYLLTLGLYLVANLAAQLGILLCCVGVFATGFWATCVLAWGLGETARLGAIEGSPGSLSSAL